MDDQTHGHVPYDLEVEAALLGSLLVDNGLIDIAAAELEPEQFYEPLHQRLFEMCIHLTTEGKVTPLILYSVMKTDPGLKEMGGIAYISSLLGAAPSGGGIKEMVRVIADRATRRTLIRIGEDLVNSAYDDPVTVPAHQIASDAASAILDAGEDKQNTTVSLSVAMEETIGIAERHLSGGARIRALPTGLNRLDDAMGGIQPRDRIAIAGRTGMGKEQPVDTPVFTPSGWRTMGDLQAGDYVFGVNGTPTKIVAVWPQGVKQAYEVKFRDLTSTECGIDHLWSVSETGGRNRGNSKVLSLGTLIKSPCDRLKDGRHYARWKIPVASPVDLPAADLPIDPYVLGVLIGDGALSGTDLRYSNPDMDSDVRLLVSERLPKDVVVRENRSGACPYFALSGPGRRDLRAKISALGLDVKSGEKFLPQVYLLASISQRLDLLRGLMDTDGSCLANRTHFYTTAEALAYNVAELVRSLGGIAIMRKYTRKEQEKADEWHVNVKMDVCPFYTVRKASAWKPTPPCKTIFSIAPSRMVEQVCITVEAFDGLYLTNDFIVTHNSIVASGIANGVALSGAPVLILSADMRRAQWSGRAACELAQRLYPDEPPINYSKFRKGTLTGEEIGRLSLARGHIQELPIFLDDNPKITLPGVRGRLRAMARRFKGQQGLLVVDFLQKVEPPKARSYKDRRRDEDLTQISYDLGDFVADVGWSLLALVQLKNKDTDSEGTVATKPPTVADIRESGGIEMAFDIVIGMFRPGFPIEHNTRKSWPDKIAELKEIHSASGLATQNVMQLLGFKNRDAGSTDLDLNFWCDMRCGAVRDEEPWSPAKHAADLLNYGAPQ